MNPEFSQLRAKIDEQLKEFVDNRYPAHANQRLFQAISYSFLAPGKRVRASLCILSGQCFAREVSYGPALALEMVHAYSLVHDDLPCMDNDSLRRGIPTAHVAFDEATALLVGDALLTDAFGMLANQEHLDPVRVLEMVRYLARASGSSGMVLGQSMDMSSQAPSCLEDLLAVHRAKTGALIGASCAMGALSGGATSAAAERFYAFGETLGVAFQLCDDLLDDQPNIGKTPGKDRRSNKRSVQFFLSEASAKDLCASLTAEALSMLDENTDKLKEYALSLLDRKY